MFSALLFVSGCAFWAEAIRHYRRPVVRRGYRYKRPIGPWRFVFLGFGSWFILAFRALWWLTRHIWRWDIEPRWRWLRHGLTRLWGNRERQAPAVAQMALPAAPVHALGAGEWYSAPDGSIAMVTRMSDGSSRVMPLLHGEAS